jgi:hypothetical protein
MFPSQFSFHRLLHIHHHLSSGTGTLGQTVDLVTFSPKKLRSTAAFLSGESGSEYLASPGVTWGITVIPYQHFHLNLNSGPTLCVCENQSWFKVEAVPVFHFD